MTITRENIIAVLGPVDDTLIAEILASGATTEELIVAWGWITNEEALVREGIPHATGRTAELIDLLSEDDEDEP
ncbi:hypothetical protein [Phyllobacterium leguminum]|uniref:Uncharacterized protein n=1 Tax=Phyllobacterium leguminum TaxID=314237 RepID=A0A318TEL0_9HYPH|nr:hypothetical protein [Phyllobacterium leguminum]PYE89943.1 hypothetical protein C7477_10230 [Phyllobacterium leguminum]